MILIVDDDADTCRMLIVALRAEWRMAIAVDTGARAMQFLEALTPDLVLLDLRLPDIHGHDILLSMRSHWQYSGIPVIIHSGRNSPEIRADSMRFGAQAHIGKASLTWLQFMVEINRHSRPFIIDT